MGALLILLAFLIVGLCLAKGKSGRRRFLAAVGALLYLPIGILLALTKNYK